MLDLKVCLLLLLAFLLLQVGTRQHGDSASASKKQSKTSKVAQSTSGSLGFRLGGMQVLARWGRRWWWRTRSRCLAQVYQANLGRYICRTKTWGRGLSVAGLKSALRQFFSNGVTARSDVIR